MENLVKEGARNPNPAFWQDKRVLVTGHTGFKGAWLALWLRRLGARLTGVSLQPATEPSLAELTRIDELIDSRIVDIRDTDAISRQLESAAPEIVFHLAARALVRPSYREPLPTFATNVQGTANLLEAARRCGTAKVVVAITTDKVYESVADRRPYRESDPLGGHDPYSASKAAAEIVITSYRASFMASDGIALASARAGNVIGGGDWADDRLIPDIVRAWSTGKLAVIRRPNAVRPWQHVLEPLTGYLKLAERLWQQRDIAGAFNFGPPPDEIVAVRDLVTLAQKAYGAGQIEWGDGTEGPHETEWLVLENSKARDMLGVVPRWPLATAVQRTMHWYRQQHEGEDARKLCNEDIAEFELTGDPLI